MLVTCAMFVIDKLWFGFKFFQGKTHKCLTVDLVTKMPTRKEHFFQHTNNIIRHHSSAVYTRLYWCFGWFPLILGTKKFPFERRVQCFELWERSQNIKIESIFTTLSYNKKFLRIVYSIMLPKWWKSRRILFTSFVKYWCETMKSNLTTDAHMQRKDVDTKNNLVKVHRERRYLLPSPQCDIISLKKLSR